MNRLHGLDLVRGLCAALVCVYHVLLWAGGPVLHTLGSYCVYVFFAVSGASLYLGYKDRLNTRSDLTRFFVRRFLRLAPLYTGAVLFGLFLTWGGGHDLPDMTTIALNVSLLFGFAGAGTTSLVTGGWSIGIEVIFYVMFPLLLAIMTGRFIIPAIIAAFLVQHAYINAVLSEAESIGDAWSTYTQPVSFIFYFVAGMGVAHFSNMSITVRRPYWFLLVIFFLTVAAFTAADKLEAMTGIYGVFLSLISVGIVYVSTRLPLGEVGIKISKRVGDSTYGVYLIHTFVYGITQSYIPIIKTYPLLAAFYTLLVTSLIALSVDRWFEKPVRRWITNRLIPSAAPRTS